MSIGDFAIDGLVRAMGGPEVVLYGHAIVFTVCVFHALIREFYAD